MDTATALAVITFSGLMHATFQLSVSVLTLLSGHALGDAKSKSQLFRLTTSFLLGSAVMTLLLICTFTLLSYNFFGNNPEPLVWSMVSGVVLGIGVSVWLFYYRNNRGTQLWIPRPIAGYLHDRSRHTDNGVESFALGTMGILGELLFTVAPMLVAGLMLTQLSPAWQLIGLVVYIIASILPLVVVWMLIGAGHSVSEIQKWRESNKYFLQFVAGTGLVVLAVYVYIVQVVSGGA